jgi:hypothetical protein
MTEIGGTFHPDLFRGRAVLVSGGTSGIGAAIARAFVAAGAEMTATGAFAREVEATGADPLLAAANRCEGIRSGRERRVFEMRSSGSAPGKLGWGKRSMTVIACFAGLDMSLSTTVLCVVDDQGQVVFEGSVATDAGAIATALASYAPGRIGLEAGPMSEWLHTGLVRWGLEAVLMEMRQARAALKASLVKTDRVRSDAKCRLCVARQSGLDDALPRLKCS